MPQSNESQAPQLLSLCSRAGKPQPLKPSCTKACALQQEKPPQYDAQATQLEEPLLSSTREKPKQQPSPAQPKVK